MGITAMIRKTKRIKRRYRKRWKRWVSMDLKELDLKLL